MNHRVCDALCLDTAGTDGLTTEVSQVVAMDGHNTVQVEVVLLALTATSVGVQVQVSNDGTNWDDQGSSQSMAGVGRKIFTAVGNIGTAQVRLKFTLDGSGKAILHAFLAVSEQ